MHRKQLAIVALAGLLFGALFIAPTASGDSGLFGSAESAIVDLQTRVSALEAQVAALQSSTTTTAPSTTASVKPTTTTQSTATTLPGATFSQATINAAPAGSTLTVPAGVWTGPFVISKSLKLVGSTDAILTSHSTALLTITGSNVTIEGITIRGDYAVTEQRGVTLTGASNITLKSLNIYDVGYSAVVGNPVTNLTVDDCTIRHCGDFGVHTKSSSGILVKNCTMSGFASRLYPGHGIYFSNSTDCTATGNVISDVQRTETTYEVSGIKYASSTGLCSGNTITDSVAGISIPGGYNVTVENNTCRNLSYRGIYLLAGAHDCTIRGNTVDIAPIGFEFSHYNTWPTRITLTGNTVASVGKAISLGSATSCTVTGNSWQ